MDVEKGYHHAAAAATASSAAAAATSNLGKTNCSNSLNHHESVELLSTIKLSSNHLVLDGVQEKKRLEEEDSLGNDISSALEVTAVQILIHQSQTSQSMSMYSPVASV